MYNNLHSQDRHKTPKCAGNCKAPLLALNQTLILQWVPVYSILHSKLLQSNNFQFHDRHKCADNCKAPLLSLSIKP